MTDKKLIPPPPPITVPSIVSQPMPTSQATDDVFGDMFIAQQPAQQDPFDDFFSQQPAPTPQAPVQQQRPAPPPEPQWHPQPLPLSEGEPPMNAFEESFYRTTGHRAEEVPDLAMQAGRQIGGAARKLPIVGDLVRGAEKAVNDTVTTAKGVASEVSRGPMGALEAAAGAIAGIPAGIISVPQAVANIANSTYRGDWHKALEGSFYGPALKSLDMATRTANTLLNRPENAPVQVKEAYQNLPPVKPLLQKSPHSSSVGELVGGAIAAPIHVPGGPITKGVIGGGAFGTGMEMEHQIQQGKQPNVGEAVKEGGIPGAFIGGAFGLGAKALGAGKAKPKATEESKPTGPSGPLDSVQLPDGQTLSMKQAGEMYANPETPPELKQQIAQALDARDRAIVGEEAPQISPEANQLIGELTQGMKPPAPAAEPRNPIDPMASPEQKLQQIKALSQENHKIVQPFTEMIDSKYGTKSGTSFKEDHKIIEKSNRPSILEEKPWFDVDHIRDAYRFKTVLPDLNDLPNIIGDVRKNGFEIIKPDVDKVLDPKGWGWRISAFDLRMPNGQMVEYYLPVMELEAAKKAGNHELFEKWRNEKLDELTPEQATEMQRDMQTSRDRYQQAWDEYLKRTGQTEADVRASLNAAFAEATKEPAAPASAGENRSLSSSAENLMTGNQVSPLRDATQPESKMSASPLSETSTEGGIRSEEPLPTDISTPPDASIVPPTTSHGMEGFVEATKAGPSKYHPRLSGFTDALVDKVHDTIEQTGKAPDTEVKVQRALDQGMEPTHENIAKAMVGEWTPEPSRTSSRTQSETETPETPATEEKTAGTQSDITQTWRAERSPDPEKSKKGYHDVVLEDEHGNELDRRSSKRSLAEAERVAAKLNSGELKPTQGKRDLLTLKKESTDHRSQIVENGKPLPDSATPELKGKLGALATATHVWQKARAKFEAAHEAFTNMNVLPKTDLVTMTKRPKATYIEEVENLGKDALKTRPDEVGLEVQTEKRVEPGQFKLPSDPHAAAENVVQLHDEMKAAEKAYNDARKAVAGEVKTGMEKGELPDSLNIDHKEGTVNIRAVPKQGTPLAAEARAVRERLAVPTVEEVSRIIKAIKEFIAGEEGSGPVEGVFGGVLDHILDPKDPIASIGEGAKKSKEISDLANAAEPVKRVFTLRRTLDIVHDHDPALHKTVWEAISKEAITGRGIKFEPSQEALVDKSLSMTPDEIRGGANGLDKLTIQQRNYLATRRAIRQAAAKAVDASIKKTEEYYVDPKTKQELAKPNQVQHTLNILTQLRDSLRGGVSGGDAGTFSLGRTITQALYDYVFKWNVPYHALNLLDPVVTGSARVGFMNVMKAKTLLQTDKAVAAFIKSHDSKGPLGQLRSEVSSTLETPKGVKETAFTGIVKKVKKVQDMVPDLPSESWNFQDTLAASLIAEGNRIKYKGGGVQYLKDMAEGKLSLESQVEGYTNALQATMDVTGAGTFGLDRDPIQANPGMRYVIQFASQPYRVARLMTKWAKEKNFGAMGTFIAATALTSGASGVPTVVHEVMENASPQTRAMLYAVEDALDSVNVVNKVLGRDLRDKMQYDLIPILGGAQANLVMDTVTRTGGDLINRKMDKVGATVMLLALSAALGGGGVQIGRVIREAGNAQAGEKTTYAQPSGYLKEGRRPLGKETFGNYSAGEALSNMIFPGRSTREGEFVKSARRADAAKRGTWFGGLAK